MKKTSAKITTVLLSAILTLCACREGAELPERTVANGSFGGIVFDPMAKTAQSAESIPTSSATLPTDSEEFSEETSKPEETAPVSASVSSSSAALTTAAAAEKSEARTNPPDETTASPSTTTTTAGTTTKPPASTTTVRSESATKKETTTTAEEITTTTTTTTAAVTTTTTTTAAAPKPSGGYAKNSYQAVNHVEMKGVWISYLEISALLRGKSESEFRQAAAAIYDNCASLGINTVFVHARAFGDAFYFSDLFPFTKHISGTVGVRTAYDPYPILIDEAHKRGISFHAWINPLRLCGTDDLKAASADLPIKRWYGDAAFNGKYLVNVSGTWYLNPAYPEAVRLVGDGVREIVSRYDVDGVHIDDYFYPTTDASFDSAAYAASDASSLSAFRVGNCNTLVREIYNAVHECSGSAVFGASTQGSMSNNLNQLYADAEAWCKGGYVDYFAPQIYYGFENSAQPFKRCTDEWNTLVDGTKTKLCIGLAIYKIGTEDQWAGGGKYEWQNTDTMLKRQIEYAKGCKNYGGVALYSYNYLFTSGYVTAAIKTETENFRSLLTSD